MHNVFIDGQVGTTGLRIADRLGHRNDIVLVDIPYEQRKDEKIKTQILNEVDLVILCLPDKAARESVAMIRNDRVRILDASTAHRVDSSWVYGLPELAREQRAKIISASRVSNPGCYPTGFLLGIVPLLRAGIVPADYPIAIDAVSGYSGGGRQLIEKYEKQKAEHPDALWSCRKYSLQLAHKHIPEMKHYAGLLYDPIFIPSVAHFEQGMLVSIPLTTRLLKKGTTAAHLQACLMERYATEKFVEVFELNDFEQLEGGFLSPLLCNDTNRVDIMLFGNSEQVLIAVRLDNLGKGASGAAIQNLNLMLGENEDKGLNL
ncbi:MAG: N-acetyl-gamma-glutamyl-phosphate reductase [SAR324 cluster bacterium]|nr:N-acetyl-gamma-glutamyl-phosphate reductase [SAR324 cluster bacterium]